MMATEGIVPSHNRSWYDMAVDEEIRIDNIENVSPSGRSRIFGHPVTSTPIRRDDRRERSSRRLPARRRLADGYGGRPHVDQDRHGRRQRVRSSDDREMSLRFSSSPDYSENWLDKERSPLRELDARPSYRSMAEATDSWAKVVAKMGEHARTSSERAALTDLQSSTCVEEPRDQPLA